VVIEGNRCEVGVGEFVIGDISPVDLKFKLVSLVEDSHGTNLTRRQIFDGVVEVELLDLSLGTDRLLNLRDEHVLGTGRECSTLISVKIGIVGVNVPRMGSSRGAPSDTQLYVMVLEGH